MSTRIKVISDTVTNKLLPFASTWWYPWAVGALSALNNFVLIMSPALVVLFISGVLAKPDRYFITAVANAVGVTVGAAINFCDKA